MVIETVKKLEDKGILVGYLVNGKTSTPIDYKPVIDYIKDGGVVEEADVYEPTYSELRQLEYNKLNQFEMQYDDAINGTTTWIDAINAIKEKYPKI